MFVMLQALQMDKIAAKFHQVTEQIEAALSRIPYDKLAISEEVREQVNLESVDLYKNCCFHSLFLTNDRLFGLFYFISD